VPGENLTIFSASAAAAAQLRSAAGFHEDLRTANDPRLALIALDDICV
jgi:hypothetical protein